MSTRIFLFFSLISYLAFPQKVIVKSDTTNIRIGEQFMYQININDTANVILPEKIENLKNLEVVNDIEVDTLKNALIKKYVMTGFDSGAFYIPSQQIFIKNRSYITDSILINVATIAIDTTKQKLFPIKAIQSEPLVYDDFKPYIIWVILILILIAVFVYYFVFRKKPIVDQEEPIVQIPPYDEAIEKLKKLDNKLLWQNNQIKKYYSELTEIIRDFIEKELKIPALEITTQELIEALSNLDKSETLQIDKETTTKLNSLLSEADLVKFAKSTPLSHEIEDDRKDAENILNDLKPLIIEEAENDELE
jgi:hypothetical protein